MVWMMNLRGTVPFHLRRAHRLLNRALLQRIGDHDVTAEQYAILRALQGAGEVSQSEIAHDFCADAGTVTAMLALLERRGLVRRRQDESDRRVRRVSLTSRGERLAEQLAEITQPIRNGIDKTLSKAERALLVELLDRLVAGVVHECAASDLDDLPLKREGQQR
jgi:DNA-binding MarR family transcriptional regulator